VLLAWKLRILQVLLMRVLLSNVMRVLTKMETTGSIAHDRDILLIPNVGDLDASIT
jgi:hypothetical protein